MDTCWSLTVLAILILSIAGIFPVLCRFYNSAQVMQEKALSSGQIYTSSKNFTLTPIATDVRTVSHPWKILGWIHAEKKTNLNLKRRESFWVATFSRSIVDPNFQLEKYFPAFSSLTDSNCPFSDKSSRVQIRAWWWGGGGFLRHKESWFQDPVGTPRPLQKRKVLGWLSMWSTLNPRPTLSIPLDPW